MTVKSSPSHEIRENSHVTPNKRRRIDGTRSTAHPSLSVISLDHSQDQDGSEDELSFSTKPLKPVSAAKGNKRHNARSQSRAATFTPNTADHLRPDPRRSESADESAFTKNAARQRKAEKDAILGSSSEDIEPLAGETTSRFFPTTEPSAKLKGKTSNSSRHEALPESPDAIQGDETHPQQDSRMVSNPKLRTRDLGKLIEGGTASTTLIKQSRSITKFQTKQMTEFKLLDLLYPGMPSASTYTIMVDIESKDFSLNTVEVQLADGPLFAPRSIRQISYLNYADGSPVVSMAFSQSGQVPDKLFLRFASEKGVYDFIMLLQKLVPTLTLPAHTRTL